MNNKPPKVSVIVCVLECNSLVINCLRSIAEQSFKDFEIILVVKGAISSYVYRIISAIVKPIGRMTVIEQKEGKLSDARNLGLEVAKGDLLTFVDGDDLITSNHLARLVASMEDDIDAVISMPELVGSFSSLERRYLTNLVPGTHFVGKKIISDMPVVVWGRLFRKAIIDRFSIRFPTNVIFEDNFFHWAYLSVSQHIRVVNDKTYIYHARSSTLMGTMKKHFEKEGIDNIRVLQAIVNFLIHNDRTDFLDHKLFRRYFLDAVKYTSDQNMPELESAFMSVLNELPSNVSKRIVLRLALLGYPIKQSLGQRLFLIVKSLLS